MNKMKKIVIALLLVTTLVACGSKKETVTICEGDIIGLEGAYGTAEYTAKGDIITSYKTVQNIPYASFGMEKDDVKLALEVAQQQFPESDNIESTYDYGEEEVSLTVVIKDLASATAEEFEVAGLQSTEGAKISLKQTVELQESSSNMTCTLQGE